MIERYAKEGDHVLNIIKTLTFFKNRKDLLASLERHVEITFVHHNISNLELWTEGNTGYLQVLEEAVFTVKGLIDYLVRKVEKRSERKLKR